MYKGDKRKAGGTFLITLLFLIFVFSKNVFGFDFQPKEIIPDTLEIENTSHTRPVLGLALSGGGAKGLAHVGVLKVIEEAGLEVDVVSGTSMGAIVGGLYAMGYSVEELESLALSTDWVGILNDQPSRREMAMEQKQYEGRYSLSLPLSGWNVALPSGVIAGQKVGKLLVNLTWPVHHVSDFRDLPRAFSCVATDIQSGEAVVLDHGFLPEAMRASFSIPSIMTPVMMDNQLLIDGFVARNLPAEDAKALGADILIGVDVGRNPLNPDQINSFIDVLNQTMSIQGEKANVEQRKLCDFLISPQLNDLEFMDFTNAKEFIIRGEEAAREFLPQLRALADSLNQSEKVRPFYHPIAGDSVRVLKVIVNGLEKTDETLIQGLLDFKIPQNVSKKQLELNVDRIYSSLFFERVTYKTLPVPGGVNLIINVVEKEADQLNFGFHYDTEDKAAVLLNATLYNRLWSNSTLSFDVRLGNNTGTRLDYIKYIGVRPRVGFGISVSTYESDQMLSATALDPTADALFMIPFSYQHDLLDITFGTTISTHSLIGIGFDIESMTFSVDNVTEAQAKILNQTYDSVHAYLMWYFDSLDQIVFPKNGLMFNAVVKQGVDIEDQEADVGNVVYNREFQLMGALPLNKKWVLQNKIIIGYHDGGTIPLPRFNYGGVDNFYGMKSGEMSGNKTFMVRAAVQWEPWTRKYIIVGTDVGMAGDSIELSPDELENGFGITLGMLTPLGPVQWTTHSGTGSGAGTHIRIGYLF